MGDGVELGWVDAATRPGVVCSGAVRRLGVAEPEAMLRFGAVGGDDPAWRDRRALLVEDRPAFELSYWCGTCPFLFRRLAGSNQTLSLTRLQERLASMGPVLDEQVVQVFGELLPSGRYLPLLLHVEPVLVRPADAADYFSHEQVDTWGEDAFWGLPEHPRTPYYRTFQTPVGAEAHLYEFVVPMVPPTWNTATRVQHYVDLLDSGEVPTAVAVSTLDVCQPARDAEPGPHDAHWGLTHFLLDGHHKLEAAARAHRPVQLLALVALDAGLATADQVALLEGLRAQPSAPRHTDHGTGVPRP